jgi:hypothetical protein
MEQAIDPDPTSGRQYRDRYNYGESRQKKCTVGVSKSVFDRSDMSVEVRARVAAFFCCRAALSQRSRA